MPGYVPRPNPLAFLNLAPPDDQPPQGRQNPLTPPWAYAGNPVGTETTQGMGMPQGPFNQVQWMRPDGTPVTAADMAQAHGQVQQAMDLAPTIALGMLGDAPGIKAFHGSPYSFDAFDASKIGSGEGAQAYGHGLYFAGNEGVARGYRDKLTGTPQLAVQDAQSLLRDSGGDFDKASSMNADMWKDPNGQPAKQVEAILKHWQANGTDSLPPMTGHMYEVNIAANPEHFLDWDKPLSEQSQHVQDALKQLGTPVPSTLGPVPDWLQEATGRKDYVPTGAWLYGRLAEHLAAPPPPPPPDPGGWGSVPGGTVDMRGSDPVAAAAALRDAGIPGIKYLDAGSRAAGEGSHNHVVFDPATIEILRKYGIAGLGLGLGAAATQQGNGQ
jgi:hypothetical protein